MRVSACPVEYLAIMVFGRSAPCGLPLMPIRIRAFARSTVESKRSVIVEDTILNREVRPQFGPGPAEAVEQFLSRTDDFAPDPECEKFLMSFNPGGFLLRR